MRVPTKRTVAFAVLAAGITGGAAFGIFRAQTAPTTLRIAPVKNDEDRAKLLKSGELPIQLTSSDGSGLRLSSVKASAAIEDPLALTELHLTFENPEQREREGTFRITLPQGASVSRFAMKIGEVWQEGDVVEKQQARQVYEDLLHRNQDPALLEKSAGNEFTARVYPIPARGKKEIIVAYSEVLEAGSPYVVPLKGLPTLSAIDIDVRALGANKAKLGGNGRWALHQTSLAPAEDFVVGAENLPRSGGLRSNELVIARIVPFTSSRPDPIDNVVFLVDTSASRGLGLVEEAKLLEETIKKLPAESRVSVACFDQEVVSLFEGTAASYGDRDTKAIIERGALGASDFEGALAWAGAFAQKKNAHRVVLVTDGVATAGEVDNQRIKKEVEKLRAAKVERIDAIAIGGLRDDGFLRSIARAGVLDRDGAVLDGTKVGPVGLASRLGERTTSGIPIKVEGAVWSWPRTLDGLQTGDEIVVHAEMPAGASGKSPIKIDVGGQIFTPDLRAATRQLVQRSWAQAKIQSLIEAPPPAQDANATKASIIALSTQHRVLSPFTAMLVVEGDGEEGGLSRNKKNREILTVDNGRVAVLDESKNEKAKAKEREEAEKEAKKGTKASSEPTPKPAGQAAPLAPTASGFAPPESEPVPVTNEKKLPPATRKEEEQDGWTRKPSTEDSRSVDEGKKLETPAPAAPSASAVTVLPAPPPPPPPQPSTPPKINKEPASGDDNAPPPVSQKRKAPLHVTPPPAPTPAPTTVPRPAPAPSPRGGGGGGGSWRGDLDRERAPAPAPVHQHAVVVVQSGLLKSEVDKVLKQAAPQLRACYNGDGSHDLDLQITIGGAGAVTGVVAQGGKDLTTDAPCALRVLQNLKFPSPANGLAIVNVRLTIGDNAPPALAAVSMPKGSEPYNGRFMIVMQSLERGEKQAALAEARKWHDEHPDDVMGLLAFGEALEATGDVRTAARAYGSILELYPMRADSRRFAGERLERLKDADGAALRLALDTYKKAVEQRPDHPAGHRLYAYALLKHGEHEKAFEAIRAGTTRQYPPGRFVGVQRILHEDLGLVAAAWAHAEPHRASEVKARLRAAGGSEENEPSLRFVLNWETDNSDVDLHITSADPNKKGAAAAAEHYANVRDGYGPECFTIRGPADKRAYPFGLHASYSRRGPMGYGMGKVSIVEHDGKGNLVFEERPYVVMLDHAALDLGKVDRAALATNPSEKLATFGKAGF